MKRRSVFTKLLAGNLLLVGVIVAVIFAVAYSYLNKTYHRRGTRNQQQLAEIFQRSMERSWPLTQEQIDVRCKDWVDHRPLRLTVIAADGQVLGDSQADPLAMANHKTADRPEVLAALDGQPGMDIRPSETLGTEFRYVALPIHHDGQVAAVVRVAVPVTAIAEGGEYIRNALLTAAVVSLVAAAALGLLLSWILYAPLREIALASRRIASGNLSTAVPVRGSSEVAQLARTLNEMRIGIRKQIDLISAQRENLAAVVTHLQEGVLALDEERRIVLMNHSAVQMLTPGLSVPTGQQVQSVVRNAELLDVLDELVSGGSIDRQIEIDVGNEKRILELHAEQAEQSPQGIATLLVLHDVTEIVRTAAVKAEFVANASHELRTPLATIRAAIDSINSIEPGDREALTKFTGILDRHARRLENMTRDLLDLHTVESRASGARVKAEPIGLGDLAEWAKGHFADQAQRKGVKLTITAQPPEGSFRSDRAMVQLTLRNLVDNAIKFTPAEGKVDCLLAGQGDGILMRVTDTGCGIEPEFQPRVFERFFQVDAARSGVQERGTGLGLSIVKHAADRLGATVHLDSEPGRGTAIEVLLPSSPERT